MAFKIVIRPRAYIDIDEAVAFYEGKLNGLGARFLDKLSDAFDRLKENPLNFLIVQDPVRRILLKSFPYKILYFIGAEETIVILGVIHSKRSKRYLKKRLK